MSRQPLYLFYTLAFGITWGVGGLALLVWLYDPAYTLSKANPLYDVAAFGPTIAGFIVVGREEGKAGIKQLFRRVVPRWAGVPWYLGVIIGFPAVMLVAGRMVDPELITKLPRWDRLLCLIPFTLVTDTGPLGEEFGWRGFALPFILKRRSPLAAAVILGLVWGVWHLPTFFIATLSQSKLWFPAFLANRVALSVIMTGSTCGPVATSCS